MRALPFFTSLLICIQVNVSAQLSEPDQVNQAYHDVASFRMVDYDDDGLPDIVTDNGGLTTTGESPATHFVLYHNQGGNVFTEVELFDLIDPVMESWGDVNGDDLMDMIFFSPLATGTGQSVFVQFGEGSYQFSDPYLVFQSEADDESMAFLPLIKGISNCDLNDDGSQEVLICLNYDVADPTLSYDHVGFFYSLSWDGSGFDAPVMQTTLELFPGSFFSLSKLNGEDFTGDGLDDLLVFVLSDFGSDLHIYPGMGSGFLDSNSMQYIGGWDSYDYANMDSDGQQELVFSFYDNMVRYGIDGTDAHEQYAGDVPSPDICILDADGDGLKDILYGIGAGVVSGSPGEIHVFHNNNDPESDWDYVVYDGLSGQDILQLGSTDINQDGIEVIVAASNGDLFLITPTQAVNVVADFTAVEPVLCGSGSVQFNDASTGEPINWMWSFPGGTPSTSSDQNPSVFYNIPGSYDVTLLVSNGTTTDELQMTNYIVVIPTTVYFADSDGDGFGSDDGSIEACSEQIGFVLFAGDCDDANAAIHPTASETCNGLDDDCDAQTDEGVQTVFYADADGDGFGNGSLSIMACVAPSGYVVNNTDCNDSNAGIKPTATELCNGINDDCDAFTDEGCGQVVVNDNPSGAINLPVNPITVTTLGVGNLTNATPSAEATTNVVTGQDLWYKFTAPAPGIRIRVQSSSINLLVELQTINGEFVDLENTNNGPGNEYLNFGNLIEGQQYRIAVRNYNSAQGTGSFTISLSYLNDSFIVVNNPNLEYCQNVIAVPVSAFAYRFTFTSTTTGLSYQYTQNLLTNLRLTKVPGLIAGDSYQVKVNPIYNLSNGLGSMEQLIVHEVFQFQINIQGWPQVYLAGFYTCPSSVNANSFVGLNTGVCRAIDYEWEFTPSPGGSTLTHMRGSYLTNFPLTSISIVPGVTYNVRIRPKYENGMFGNWGPARCMQVASSTFVMEDENGQERWEALDNDQHINSNLLAESPHQMNFAIYPNPSHGDLVNVILDENYKGMLYVRIYDAKGREVAEPQYVYCSDNKIPINETKELAAGIYIVNIISEEWNETARLIIE
ncbi:MAG: PKD domain-containing protein [Flavobacteriales bacterium]|nr:PKD domain-containing protein [Flavobacteriales bacterium]